MTINKIRTQIENNLRLIIVIVSFAISLGFLLTQSFLVDHLNIEISTHKGQLTEKGNYDFQDYTLQVNNLIDEGSFKKGENILNRYPPIYPLILYSSVKLSILLNIYVGYIVSILTIIFNLLSALILAEIVLLFGENKRMALISSLLFLTHPYILQGLTKSMSVTPFMTFFYASLLLTLKSIINCKKKNYVLLFLSGSLLGLSMLTRPIGILLPIIFLMFYIPSVLPTVKSRILLDIAVFLFGTFLIIAPWQTYNWNNGQNIILSSNSVHSIRLGFSLADHPLKQDLNLPEDVKQLAHRLSSANYSTVSGFLASLLRELANKPIPVLKLFMIKAGRSWYGTFGQEKRKEVIKLSISLFYLILCLFGSTLYIKRNRQFKLLLTASLLLTANFWLMTIAVVSMVRYMIPVFGLMCLFIPGVLYLEKPKIINKLRVSRHESPDVPSMN